MEMYVRAATLPFCMSLLLPGILGTCDPKYSSVNPYHTACLDPPKRDKEGVTMEEKTHIVMWHNHYRANLADYGQPTAANMQKMVWDDELAYIAQKWASNCIYMHDPQPNRAIPGRFGVGQNLAWTMYHERDWNYTLYLWQSETDNFKFGEGSTDGRAVGHYTAMVWDETSKVGCGYAFCNGTKHYHVCNYGPTGNLGSRLYKPYRVGTPGADCPSTVDKKTGLCDCGGMTCNMGGELDVDTCNCKCRERQWISRNGECYLNCAQAKDSFMCSTEGGPWSRADCGLGVNVPYDYCPIMCNWCPDISDNGNKPAFTTKEVIISTTKRPTPPPSTSAPSTSKVTPPPSTRAPSTAKPKTTTAKPKTLPPPSGLEPCKEIEKAMCGQPSATGYWPRSYCSQGSWMAFHCPAMCQECAASRCRDYGGKTYTIGEQWVTKFGQMTCTRKGVIVESGCMREGRFIASNTSLTYNKDGIRWTCKCTKVDTSRHSLRCTGVYW